MGFFPYVPHKNCPLEDILTGASFVGEGMIHWLTINNTIRSPIPIHSLHLAPVSVADFQSQLDANVYRWFHGGISLNQHSTGEASPGLHLQLLLPGRQADRQTDRQAGRQAGRQYVGR